MDDKAPRPDRSPAAAGSAFVTPERPSAEMFVHRLTQCGLMTSAEVQAFLDTLSADRRPADAQHLAEEMLRCDKLTKFQARAVYEGKTDGLVLGNYVVLDKLGQGGMGEVYKARHRKMDRVVALKILPPVATRSPDAVKRFQREVKAAAKLSHPNIVTAHDADEAHGVHFLVMQYVAGHDLDWFIKNRGAMAVAAAVDCVLQAAEGLQYAHQQGVIHRDIKPSNLLLDAQGTVKILDMGLARVDRAIGTPEAEDDLTQTGQVMGTLDFMSPEQAMDTREADARADVYSLGCTLYYLLTGTAPYRGDTMGKKIVAHREQPIPSLGKTRPDVPQSLDAVYRKMLAKRPDDRQQSMGEVITELRACTIPDVPPPTIPGDGLPAVSDTKSAYLDWLTDTTAEYRGEPSDHAAAARLPAKIGRRWRIALAVALAAGLLGLLWLGIVLRIKMRDDTVVIEIEESKEVKSKPGSDVPAAWPRAALSPGPTEQQIAARRQEYLDHYLKLLRDAKPEDIPADRYAAQFSPQRKALPAVATAQLTLRYFADWECKRPIDPDRIKDVKTACFKAYFDPQGRPCEIQSYDKDGGAADGPQGCAAARTWYDAQGHLVQEAFFGTDGKPEENRQLVMVAQHACVDGRRVESRFFDADGKPAEDHIGVHRRCYRGDKQPLEYRIDGSPRVRWLPPIPLGNQVNYQDSGWVWHPVLSPDGKELYFHQRYVVRSVWQGGRWSKAIPVLVDGKPLVGLRLGMSSDGALMSLVAWKQDPYGAKVEYPDLPNYGGVNLYICERKDGVWQSVRNAGPKLNRVLPGGGAGFVPRTHALCVAGDDRGGQGEFWLSEQEGDQWGDLRSMNLGPGGTPAFSPDGRRLYFVSDRKGSYGPGCDLWVVEKRGDGWSRPINLGPEIHTGIPGRLHYSSPTFLPHGDVMYFCHDFPGVTWRIMVTGRADSEAAIRHMADIYAWNDSELPPPAASN